MKESLIQTAIEQYLRIMEDLGKLVYIKQNSGATKIGDRFIRYGKAGAPDFMIYLNNGRSVHLEIKNEKGRQNKNQSEYQKRIEKLGHRYYIIRGVDEAEKLLKEIEND
jgi:hypothetical protein